MLHREVSHVDIWFRYLVHRRTGRRDAMPRSIPKISFESLRTIWSQAQAPQAYRDTLARLFSGNFSDLSAEQRQAKVDQIIQLAAAAAMVLGAAPVPALDLPVQAVMVRAVAKVHGLEGSERRLLWRMALALGLGFMLRQGWRLVPWIGGATHLARVYGSTCALGQAADFYFARLARAEAVTEAETRRIFVQTRRAKEREQALRLENGGMVERVRALRSDREAGRIGDSEFFARLDGILGHLPR
jgi:uncharacterized protein (DUF697 family)